MTVVVIFKLSLLFVVGMCKSSIHPSNNPSSIIKKQNQTKESSSSYMDREDWKPLTIFEPFWDFGLSNVEPLTGNDTSKINLYLIKHPYKNEKVLKAFLDMTLSIEDFDIRLTEDAKVDNTENCRKFYRERLGVKEKDVKMQLKSTELEERKFLEFVDTLFKEVPEQLPFEKKEIQEFTATIYENIKESQREKGICHNPGCKTTWTPILKAPKFIQNFFEFESWGFTKKELANMFNYLHHNLPVKRKVYEAVLNDRLYYDSFMVIMNMHKQESDIVMHKILAQHIKTLKIITLSLQESPCIKTSNILRTVHKMDKLVNKKKSTTK